MNPNDPTRELVLQLIRTRMAFRQAVQRELKRNQVEMTFEMLQVMHPLWARPGVSQQYLAEKTAKDKACLTNLINNLEKKGWVIRREDPADRRNRLVYLTPGGEAMAAKVKPLLQKIYDRTGEGMNRKQTEACLNHLRKFHELLDKL